ncbi:LysE type translocator [Flavobacteriaceae bacterium MAR_2010_188]|nr:LysE type translocator [Flavobacteriaceae bacterium MAR_2010_188]
MTITTIFFLGFIIAYIGVIPPGLLNMTAAKISLKEGHVRGIMFSIGASVVVIFQAGIAAVFARYLSNHPDVVNILQRVALVIFILVTIYYLRFANNNAVRDFDTDRKSKHSRFLQGIFLSAINLFPVPFHAYMTISIASLGWMEFNNINIASYVAGATCGTFAMFYLYIFLFEHYISKNLASQRNMNRTIGYITGLVAVITLIQIIIERQ